MPRLIRRLTPADARDFRSLRLAALRSDPTAFGSTPEIEAQQPLEWFAQRISSQPFYGAFENGALIGFAGTYTEASPKQAHKRWVWGVYTASEARGRGVSKSVLERVIAEAREAGFEWLNLAVGAANPGARRVYEGLGFLAYGTEPAALKVEGRDIDEILMTLRLKGGSPAA